MKNKLNFLLFISLIGLQILFNKYHETLKFNIDFLYIIIIYFSIKNQFYKCIIISTGIGLITDVFTGSILGVFGFSRALIAYLLFNFSKYIDFRKNYFLFVYTLISLIISNFIANLFFYLINHFEINLKLVLVTPILTSICTLLFFSVKIIRENLNVH